MQIEDYGFVVSSFGKIFLKGETITYNSNLKNGNEKFELYLRYNGEAKGRIYYSGVSGNGGKVFGFTAFNPGDSFGYAFDSFTVKNDDDIKQHLLRFYLEALNSAFCVEPSRLKKKFEKFVNAEKHFELSPPS